MQYQVDFMGQCPDTWVACGVDAAGLEAYFGLGLAVAEIANNLHYAGISRFPTRDAQLEQRGLLQRSTKLMKLETKGFEPSSNSSKNSSDSNQGGTESGTLATIPLDLAVVLKSWSHLPGPIRAGIVALVRASTT